MKNVVVLSLLTLSAAAVHAGQLTLDPPSGVVQGTPGQTVGWGFTLNSDPNQWISVVTTMLLNETDPDIGTYSDLLGQLGGPDNGVLAPGAPDWKLPFDAGQGTGIGAFAIDPNAAIGSVDRGVLDMAVELFSANPNVCPSCAVGFTDVDVPFEVQVVAPGSVSSVPEPTMVWPLAGICAAIWFKRGRGLCWLRRRSF
jgi:hypothetical protein